MTLSHLSAEEVVSLCFANDLQIQLDNARKEFADYSIRVNDGEEVFSQHKHDSYIEKIKLIKVIHERQFEFMNKFLNEE